jgi:protein-S-isoprenylcysteine O-methyltransferase Ste14
MENEKLNVLRQGFLHQPSTALKISTQDHPGVYVPSPFLYVVFFFFSFLMQHIWSLNNDMLHTIPAHAVGWLLIILFCILAFTSIRQFIISKNTLVTIKSATSLQTTGVYAFTRNPMYLSLLLLYTGIAVFWGNWWTFILLPLLITVLQLYVIHKEELYLHHAFGTVYDAYRKKVRRWI